MIVTRRIALFALLVLVAVPGTGSASWLNELGRDLGLGWSDGYHAYEGCPDARLRSQPWQRRANRSRPYDEPLVPYLEPASSPPIIATPATATPTPAAQQPMSRTKAPAASPARTSQLHISRPNY